MLPSLSRSPPSHHLTPRDSPTSQRMEGTARLQHLAPVAGNRDRAEAAAGLREDGGEELLDLLRGGR